MIFRFNHLVHSCPLAFSIVPYKCPDVRLAAANSFYIKDPDDGICEFECLNCQDVGEEGGDRVCLNVNEDLDGF